MSPRICTDYHSSSEEEEGGRRIRVQRHGPTGGGVASAEDARIGPGGARRGLGLRVVRGGRRRRADRATTGLSSMGLMLRDGSVPPCDGPGCGDEACGCDGPDCTMLGVQDSEGPGCGDIPRIELGEEFAEEVDERAGGFAAAAALARR